MLLHILRSHARTLFNEGVAAVNPKKLIKEHVKIINCDGVEFLSVNGTTYKLQSNVFMVGFGKAVLGMARTVEQLVRPHLQAGIVSVPLGTLGNPTNFDIPVALTSKSTSTPLSRSKSEVRSNLKVIECAKNNLPDNEAHMAAQKIVDLVKSLNSDAVLIVLISGGGSALLPLPVPPVSLDEKQEIIKMLSNAGANITDLNCVRKKLSQVKGGGLARLAYPAKVVSLIISDVIGDPLDTIASGPTYPNFDSPNLAWQVIQKYNLEPKISCNVRKLLTSTYDSTKSCNFSHVNNLIIGSNSIALAAIDCCAQKMNYNSVVVSNEIQGIARNVGILFATFATNICHFWLSNMKAEQFILECQAIQRECKGHFSNTKVHEVIYSSKISHKPLCLIFGGETTVQVSGSGVGGRNQELALAFSVELHERYKTHSFLKNFEVLLLSAGTDGIDGPTDVAGAIGCSQLIRQSLPQNMDPVLFLKDNDTYNFFSKLCDGDYFVKTGHTGSNVMDVQILIIAPILEIESVNSHCLAKI